MKIGMIESDAVRDLTNHRFSSNLKLCLKTNSDFCAP